MGRGRPGKGEGHVDDLEGAEESKLRMKCILATVSGAMTVKESAASPPYEAGSVSIGIMRYRVVTDHGYPCIMSSGVGLGPLPRS